MYVPEAWHVIVKCIDCNDGCNGASVRGRIASLGIGTGVTSSANGNRHKCHGGGVRTVPAVVAMVTLTVLKMVIVMVIKMIMVEVVMAGIAVGDLKPISSFS